MNARLVKSIIRQRYIPGKSDRQRAIMDIVGWLQNLGLARYAPMFIESAIDADVLLELTENDLERLGIPLGDRKRIIRAIRTTSAKGAPQANDQAAANAERRHLTIMICDLVGSTAMSTRLDPEDMAAVIDVFQETCARIVQTYDGFLADFRGDGILAYFGYPHAHEDDAERTVRASIDIIATLAQLKTQSLEPLAVRIGIATGLVVVGNLGEGELREHAVVGDTPNVAARLQALAEPGTIVVAASTRRLLGDLFRLRDLGRHQVKGIAGPIAAWAVEGLAASESRFKAVRATDLTELIGRKDEINFLLERERLARKGEGQIVLISGEPGIGKSRLAAALAAQIVDEPYTYLRYQCSPYDTNSALRPIIVQLERAAGFKADDPSNLRLEKLEALIDGGAARVQAVAPLLAALLSIPFKDRYPPLVLSPTQQRRRTLAALLDQFEILARRRPILLLFEDVHWADATSLELLDLAIERVRQLPVLALFTFRPEFEALWVGLSNVSHMKLARLAPNETKSIVNRITAGRVLPPEVMKQIVAKTDGNPLFVEELTKAVLEADILVEDVDSYRLAGPLPPLAIPATLQDSLMARLDRRAPVREIAQVGAVIGREFSYALLRDVVGGDERALKHALHQLEQAELISRHGAPPEAAYTFKHALVRDAAYETLLKSRRYQLHGKIAHLLEGKFADVVASQPEIVAHHFTEAGLVERAIDFWFKAGKLALSRSANAEAVKHLRQGLELTQSLAPDAARAGKELEFCLALGPAIAATEGFAAPETLKVYSRARELLSDSGTLTEQTPMLWGMYLAHTMRGEHVAARDVAHLCLALATTHKHVGLSILGHRFMGQSLWVMGALVESRFHLERALELCDSGGETVESYRKFGADDRTIALVAISRTLWLLGYPDQAVAAAGQALDRARGLGMAFTTALALDGAAFLGLLGADPQRAMVYADEAMAHCAEHSLADYERKARFTLGALLTQSGETERGLDLMRRSFTATERTNRSTVHVGWMATAHASLGQFEVGLGMLDDAFRVVDVTKERFYEVELYRLRADMLSMLDRRDEAEIALQQAFKIARQQQARWWELRTATSAAKYWANECKHEKGCSILQPICDWFLEGFDTQSLKEAKLLLDNLRKRSRFG